MASPPLPRWHVCNSETEVWERSVEWITSTALNAINTNGIFRIVLAGGNTPRAIYDRLHGIETNWQAWQIWFGDERCLPNNDPKRNSRMIIDSWLHHVPVLEENINIIRGELGAELAAKKYCAKLAKIPIFDLVLLGLGEDGHTASLFQGGEWENDQTAKDALPVFDAPYVPSERVSLSAKRLSKTRAALYIITGKNKINAVNKWRQGQQIPATAILPQTGIDVLLDKSCFVSSSST